MPKSYGVDAHKAEIGKAEIGKAEIRKYTLSDVNIDRDIVKSMIVSTLFNEIF